MKKKNSRSRVEVKVPLSWRVISILSMLPLVLLIFINIFRKSGGKFPLEAGDITDPYFFGSVFAVFIPLLLYIFIADKLLKGIVRRRPGKEIVKDVAEDVAKAASVVAAEVVLDAVVGGSSSGSRSSSDSGTKGGGGDFGGGGASGGY